MLKMKWEPQISADHPSCNELRGVSVTVLGRVTMKHLTQILLQLWTKIHKSKTVLQIYRPISLLVMTCKGFVATQPQQLFWEEWLRKILLNILLENVTSNPQGTHGRHYILVGPTIIATVAALWAHTACHCFQRKCAEQPINTHGIPLQMLWTRRQAH